MAIKNIIFDLGGVIVDIDFSKTIEAFKKLGANNLEMIFNQENPDQLIDDYDIGKIKSAAFRLALKEKFNFFATDEEFDAAWNAMLLDLPKARLDCIKQLRQKYKVFLFSNTNEIHLKRLFTICQTQNGFDNFLDYFDKEYYSHIFGQRKPNPAAFIAILEENKLQGLETVFVDDVIQNIQGAVTAGLHTIHLTKEKSILNIEEMIAAIKL